MENSNGRSAKKRCELCGEVARVYCESDEAMLCWGCDAQVHGANFLVARHARALLCRCCLGPTPWRAAGPRLGPSASLCEPCCRRRRRGPHQRQDEEEDEEEEEEEEEEQEEEEGEGENQVVPWGAEAEMASSPPLPPPPAASSSSCSSRSGEESSCLKETGGNAGLAAGFKVPPLLWLS